MTAAFTLVHGYAGTPIEDVAFSCYGPFESVEVAQRAAEDLRGTVNLPREATPDNNEAWTDEGHWFGILPLGAVARCD